MSNFIADYLSGGNTKNNDLIDKSYDYTAKIHEAEMKLNVVSGNMTQAEADEALITALKENESNRDDAIDANNRQSVLNGAMNIGGIALSAVGVKGTAGAAKTMAATGAKTLAKESTKKGALSAVKNIGKNMATKTLNLGKKALTAGKNLITKGGVADDLVKQTSKSTMKVVVKKAGSEGVESAGKNALKTAGKNAGKNSLKEAGKNVSKNGRNIIHLEARVAAKETSEAVAKGGLKAGLKKAGEKGLNLWYNTSAKLITTGDDLLKSGHWISGGVLKTGGMGLSVAPAIAAHTYTTNVSAEKAAELNDTIAILAGNLEYITNETNAMVEDKDNAYHNWSEGFSEDSEALMSEYASYIDENGKFTNNVMEAEYLEKYEELMTSKEKELEELYAKYPEYGQYILENGVAQSMSAQMSEEHIDPDEVMEHSEYVEDVMTNPENSEALASARESAELYSEIDSGNGFINFIKSVHNTILHYAPVVAYAEAAVMKGVDSILEWVAPDVHTEKYEGQSITDIANDISNAAEIEFEKRAEIKENAQEQRDGIYHSADEYHAAKNGTAQTENTQEQDENTQTTVECEV